MFPSLLVIVIVLQFCVFGGGCIMAVTAERCNSADRRSRSKPILHSFSREAETRRALRKRQRNLFQHQHHQQQQQSVAFKGSHRRSTMAFPISSFTSSQPLAAFAFSSADLWAIRVASAGLSYFGFVAVTDRPRGQLQVSLQDYLQISPSMVPGAGLGLYLKEDLPQGTVLGEYPGVVLPLLQHSQSTKMQQAPLSEAYIWRFSDNQFVIDPTDESGILQDVCRGGNPSTPLSVAVFATVLPFVTVPSALCRINEPPKGRDVNVVTEEDLKARKVTFVLERDCFAGEELYIDYGLSYDRSMYSGDSGSSSTSGGDS